MPVFVLLLFSMGTYALSQFFITTQPSSLATFSLGSLTAFVFTVLTLTAAGGLLFLVTRSLRWALGTLHAFLLVLSLICYLKKFYLGSPLYPWDFAISNETAAVLPNVLKGSPWLIAGVLATVGAWSFYLWLLPPARLQMHRTWRAAGVAVLLPALTLVFLAHNPIHHFLFEESFHFDPKNPRQSLSQNGLLVSFILMKEQGEIFPPINYNHEKALALLRQYPTSALGSAIRPDIVVVMSESLFDPTELTGIRWKKDPLAFTRSLAKNRPLSIAIVPTYGNKTANSEFEFLTGESVSFFAKGIIPYVDYANGPQLSIVRSLHEAGYRTVALHPGDRQFYNREKAYASFGFDEFKSIESFPKARAYGNNVSDESILPVLMQSLASQTGPSFHFIVTIQNHHPYTSPFEFKDLLFEEEDVPGPEKVTLNYYSKLAAATDRFHHDLVEALSKRGRPTVLLIFGDHLPPLLPEFGMFKNRLVHSADPEEWTPEEKKKIFSTPLALWSNFPLQSESKSVQISFVGVRLLDRLGIPLSPFQKFVSQLGDEVPIFRKNLVPPLSEKSEVLINQYHMLQYGTFTHDLPDFPSVNTANADDDFAVGTN